MMDLYGKIIEEYKNECIICGKPLDDVEHSGVCSTCVHKHDGRHEREKLIMIGSIRKMGKNERKGIFNGRNQNFV